MREKFGAASLETQTIRGEWQHGGAVYLDQLVRVFVDVQDTAENRRFFLQLKDRLKSRFEQIELWVTSYPIDVL